jgi:hypothetical protein
MILTYTDCYLARGVTDSIETRAFADVDELGDFTTEWRDRLTVIRAYILTCLEKGAESDDTYAMKLTQYRKEFDFLLGQAKRAQKADGQNVSLLSVAIERA